MRHRQISLSAKLSLITAVLIGALFVVLGVALHVLAKVEITAEELAVLREAQRRTQQADMVHDALRNAVLNMFIDADASETPAEKMRDVHSEAEALTSELLRLDAMTLPAAAKETIDATRAVSVAYVGQGERIAWLLTVHRDGALAEGGDFNRAFEKTKTALGRQTEELALLSDAAARTRDRAGEDAKRGIVITGVLASLISVALAVLIARSIRLSLDRVRDVAQSVAEGALERRTDVRGCDEIGVLGDSVNRMADHLQATIERMQKDAERGAFTAELVDAFEMVDSEPDAHAVVARAMVAVSSEHPMELLLSDSSKAHLERAAEHPHLGSPGCTVESPFGCVAVRRGNPVVFHDSESLNACPHLRGRPFGSVSGVCVPVAFMGRSLGVLHASGPTGACMSEQLQSRLRTLGVQAGGRIGTLRAFQRTQLQASTDMLTGLSNRRAMEEALRAVIARGEPFSVILCDLDHFKRLNDEHGHPAGDDALRVFAETLRAALGPADLAARWGGEEFCVLLFGVDAVRAAAWTERVRERLVDDVARACAPAFTASFGVADSTMSRESGALIQMADAALYEAKSRGRDRAAIADSLARSGEHVRHESEQRAAVDPRMLSAAGNRRATRSHQGVTWAATAEDEMG